MKHLSFIGYGERLRPVRDWLTLLTLAGIVLLGLIVWSLWLYHRVEMGEVLGNEAPSAKPVFNPASLRAVERVFDDRAAEAAKYQDGTYIFADPSK